MAKLVSRKTTTTVTEETVIVPAAPGENRGHRYMKVTGYGTYNDDSGNEKYKPKINLNAKWLADAGFLPGDRIDVCVEENRLVISKLHMEMPQGMKNPGAGD